MRHKLLILLSATLAAGCQTYQPPTGEYVDFLREAMAASAQQSSGPADAQPAARAVAAWRVSGED